MDDNDCVSKLGKVWWLVWSIGNYYMLTVMAFEHCNILGSLRLGGFLGFELGMEN